MIKTICIIPARGGSKGLPGKNIKNLAGRPLIYWPIKAALECKLIDRVFVTTDSQEIATEAIKAGAEVPFLRSNIYAEDLTTTESTLQNALISFEEYTNEKFDICVFLTATDIFRDIDWLNIAIQNLIFLSVAFINLILLINITV